MRKLRPLKKEEENSLARGEAGPRYPSARTNPELKKELRKKKPLAKSAILESSSETKATSNFKEKRII